MKILSILSILLLNTITFTFGQNDNCNEAQNFFESYRGDCKGSISAHNCIHLDVTDSYDFEGKEFHFKWDMGDGNTQEGMEIRHCYEKAGLYTASLSLVDPVSSGIIGDEAEVQVHIKGAFSLTANFPTAEVGQPADFSYTLTYPESTHRLENVYWYFGDDQFSCGENPTHIFDSPGKYVVRLMVSLSSEADDEVLCASDTVEVKMTDPSQGIFRETFNSIEAGSRFLAAEAQYKIIKKTGESYREITQSKELQGADGYSILAFRGNSLFASELFEIAENTTDGELQKNININATTLAKTKPLQFNSIIFELDQNDLSKKNTKDLKQNIAILEANPLIKVAIGVYTNSKGSLEKGIKLSLTRGNLIKDYLISEGIAESRILVYNPENYRSLINSCVSGVGCENVDAALDRRADFKILNELHEKD